MLYVSDMGSLSETALEADELFRSDDVVVRRVTAGPTDRWVVTFDHYAIGLGFDRPGFGEAYLQSQGISAIHVMGRSEDWYQYPDMTAALATVRAATAGADRVVTYGSSMGGYAALRFANAVGATDALALSPQYSIDPKVAPQELRWTQDGKRIRWRPEFGGPMSCSATAVVVFDPTGSDRWHGERIEQDLNCRAIRLPYTAHPVTTYLADVSLLAPLLEGVLAGEFDARGFQREARQRRARNGIYLGELAAAQPQRKASTALVLARRAVNVSPGNYHAQVSLARLLSRDGHHDEALTILDSVVQASERGLTYVVDYGNALVLAGRIAEARVIVDEAMSRTSDVAHLHAWAAHICWLNHEKTEARRLIRRAVMLDPGNTPYLRALIDYYFGAPLSTGHRGVRPTPWLRIARWALKGPLTSDANERTSRPLSLRRRDDPASGGAS